MCMERSYKQRYNRVLLDTVKVMSCFKFFCTTIFVVNALGMCSKELQSVIQFPYNLFTLIFPSARDCGRSTILLHNIYEELFLCKHLKVVVSIAAGHCVLDSC